MSKVKSYGLKLYITKAFDLYVGKILNYQERGEDGKEHIYEVKQLFHFAFCWKIFTIIQRFVLVTVN